MTDKELYEQGWVNNMPVYLREQLVNHNIYRTGSLYRSLTSARQSQTEITVSLLQYGLYVARGVGNGYTHGNAGDLANLNPDPKKRRQRRNWLWPTFYKSLRRLVEKEAEFHGNAALSTVKIAFNS